MITFKNFMSLLVTGIIVLGTANISAMHTKDFVSEGICILKKKLEQAENDRDGRKAEMFTNILRFIEESGIKEGKAEDFYQSVLAAKYAAVLSCLEDRIKIYKLSGNL